MVRRFLNVWDSLARLCIPARYRFDEDSGSDENTERGRLLLRQEQASTAGECLPGEQASTPLLCWPHLLPLSCSSFKVTASASALSGYQENQPLLYFFASSTTSQADVDHQA